MCELMEVKNIRTRKDLIQWIWECVPSKKLGAGTPEEAAEWFVAIQNARFILNAHTTKDLAHELLSGIQPIKGNEEAYEEFFNAYFEEADGVKDEDPTLYKQLVEEEAQRLKEALHEHFGLREV